MNNIVGLLFPTTELDHSSKVPLYLQLYSAYRDAILSGRLASGTRLLSTRELATELKVSRNTVMTAFEQLLAEGYISGKVGSGTYVSTTLPRSLLREQSNGQPKLAAVARHSLKGRR